MENLKELIVSGLQERYPESVFSVHRVVRNNNCAYEGIMMKLTPDNPCAPVIYYEQYEDGLNSGKYTLEDVLNDIEKQIETRSVVKGVDFSDYAQMKGRTILFVINHEKNEALLQTVPHQRFLDLAVVCKVIIPFDDGMEGYMQVTDGLMKTWGITEEELFETAEKNTRERYKVRIRPISEVLQGFGVDLEELERMTNEHSEMDKMMYVADVAASNGGGLCFLYKDKIREFANENDMDLYIIPSSIHELIIIPKKEQIPKEHLLCMISDVSNHMIQEEDYLSNHLYCYLRESDEIVDVCVEETDI